MTSEQKTQISDLRRSGLSYVKIGEIVGISKDTVKTYCRRNNISTETHAVNPDVIICKNCGKPVIQKNACRKMVFCSPSCRQDWWNAHPEMVHKKAVYDYVCAGCGKAFTAYGNSHRKYCSHSCYISTRFKGGDVS